MHSIIIDAINDGREGLSRIFHERFFQDLIRRYHVNESCKERIRSFDFRDCEPFFVLKRNYCIHPSADLSRCILDSNDEDPIKWFLLLYSFSAASVLFDEKILNRSITEKWGDKKILHYLDGNIDEKWYVKRDDSITHLDLYYAPDELQTDLLKGIVDIDAIICKTFPNRINDYLRSDNNYFRREYDDFRQGVCQFMLSAGYHFSHDSSFMHEDVRKIWGMPFALSCALYISFMSGRDFYDSLEMVLEDHSMMYSEWWF